MPPRIRPAHPRRILAFFPHRRASGRVAIDDGCAVVTQSFAAIELRHPVADREARLELEVGRAIHRFHPALVAIGIDERRPNDRAAVVERVACHLGVSHVVIPTQRVAEMLLGDRPPHGYDKLAQAVSHHLPVLAPRVLTEDTTRAASLRRRNASAWRACAAALEAHATAFTSRSAGPSSLV